MNTLKRVLPLLAIAAVGMAFVAKEKDAAALLAQDARSLDKRLAMVTETLFVNPFETSNQEYKEFLTAIAHEKALLAESQMRPEGWLQVPGLQDGGESLEGLAYYHSHPAFDAYPVVNITQQGALNFCAWLTAKYNADPRRKHQKVIFRLPTKEEWLMAASPGDGEYKGQRFPWGSPYLRNEHGKPLCNFLRIDETHMRYSLGEAHSTAQYVPATKDNLISFGTMKVDSYFKYGKGLYNTSGNAAEMLAEAGHTMGGSWANSGYYMQLNAEDPYEGVTAASPFIGFRYVMEVIEE